MSTNGQLYIIKSEEGPVKIGISIHAKRRIVQLSSTSGRAFIRTFISPDLPMVENLERALHQRFSDGRGLGEWFDIDFDEAVKAARLMGAMHYPNEWKRSDEYMHGVLCRERMRRFTSPDRTKAEWNAFFAGMGQDGIDLAELADQVDMQAMQAGMGQLVQSLSKSAEVADFFGISLAPSAEISERMQHIRAQLDADLLEAGLTPSCLNKS